MLDGWRRGFTLAAAATLAACGGSPERVSDPSAARVASAPSAGTDEAAIEAREVCVGSSVVSAGTLAENVFYRAVRLDDTLVVGYFAFFSDERPWGNNWLTWTVFPALAIDLVYSHGLFVGPGYQRFAYGRGDVEGFRIEYRRDADGSLRVHHAVAQDGLHQTVQLDAADVMRIDPRRPTLYSSVWSHQLGGRGVRSKAELASLRCFGPGHVLPLPDKLAAAWSLDRRAAPAHVEALGGRMIASRR